MTRRGFRQTGELFEGAVEAVQYIRSKPDSHLKGESVAGDVVGPFGRAAGVFEIVGVILRFEHVAQVRTEGLRGLHHVRSGRVRFAGNGEGAVARCTTTPAFCSA